MLKPTPKLVSLACALFVTFYFITVPSLFAQTPTKCFEIESILVDACVSGGTCSNAASPSCSCEGKNEMVRFRIGPNPINTSNITINWPNNTFRGISPENSTTDSLVNILNGTIQSCGYLVQPVGGILPAGKEILLITSTEFCTSANSFANLSDTLYVIFQNAGNYQGHFANNDNNTAITTTPTGASSTRTTIFTDNSTGCGDTVTYDRSLLVNQFGTYGGTSAENDGATVIFAWDGTATYVNNGCQAPFVPVTANAGTGGTICQADSINLTGSASGNYTMVTWSGGSGTFSNIDSLNTTYTPGSSDSGNVVLTLSVKTVCDSIVTSMDTVNVIPPPTPAINASGPTTFCQGGNVTLTATGGTSYSWNTGATAAAITTDTSGTYTVTATTSCGSDTANINVTENIPGNASIASSDNATCNGASNGLAAVSIIGGTAPYSYSWNTTPVQSGDTATGLAAGTYTCTITDNNGCSTTTSVTIGQPSALVVNPAATTNADCDSANGSATITATGGTQPYNYSWNTNPTQTSNPATNITAGNYTCTVTDANGCSTTVATTISNNPTIASISNNGPSVLCRGDSILLVANGGTSYLWSTGATSSSIYISQGGNYSVTVTNSCGSDNTSVNIPADSVSALFTADSLSGAAPLTVSFTNSSSGGTNYYWNFGTMDSSNAFSPSYTFQHGGVYPVTLSVTNANGCSDSYTLYITVKDIHSKLEIPNVFSPNGDGHNDVFAPIQAYITDLSGSIYDRWGLLIYQFKGTDDSWDGRSSTGNPMPAGVYYYLIKATGKDGIKYDEKGFFSLIR